jgi:hypothetical protein
MLTAGTVQEPLPSRHARLPLTALLPDLRGELCDHVRQFLRDGDQLAGLDPERLLFGQQQVAAGDPPAGELARAQPAAQLRRQQRPSEFMR